MATLLMRISAPMQSWGTQSHFSHRDTGREPSKSGIIGLLCAALGRPRNQPIADLGALRMGLRIDQPGSIMRDFHTAGIDGYYKVSGSIERKNAITSERYYLSDAKFLVGLEGDDRALLEDLQDALKQPKWFLFFGRKAFLPAERVWLHDGICECDLETALRTSDFLGEGAQAAERLQVLIEDDSGPIVRNDQPISFKPRRFIPRRLKRDFVDNPACQEEA